MKTLMGLITMFFFFLTLMGLSLSFGRSEITNASNLSQSMTYGLFALIFLGITFAIPGKTQPKADNDITQKLLNLESMLEKGSITQEEFNQAKEKLFKSES